MTSSDKIPVEVFDKTLVEFKTLILAEIDARLSAALTLTVGRLRKDTIEARHLALSTNATDSLHKQCKLIYDRIKDKTPVLYTSMKELDDGEFFVIYDDKTLDELGDFRSLTHNLGAIPQIMPSELDLDVKFYGVSLGDDATDRILFVNRTNPQLTHKTGKFFVFAREQITCIEGPVFAFSPDFDFLLGPTWAVVLNQKSFEILFRQINHVEKRISTWVRGITDHLPMSDSSIDSLKQIALQDSRTWRRLQDIERRGHLAHVTLDQVAEYASKVGLNPSEVVVNGELVFDPTKRFGFLHLLNEDLYKGHLTGEVFESQRKSAMS